jgi:thioredoxin reductase
MIDDIKSILESKITSINTDVGSFLSKKVNVTYNYNTELLLQNEPNHNSITLSWQGASKYSAYNTGNAIYYENTIIILVSSNKAYEVALKLEQIFKDKQIITDGEDKRVYTILVSRYYPMPTLDNNKLNIVMECSYVK